MRGLFDLEGSFLWSLVKIQNQIHKICFSEKVDDVTHDG